MLEINTYTNKTGACATQTPKPVEEPSVLLFGNNDTPSFENCQVNCKINNSAEQDRINDIFSFLGDDVEEGLPEGPAEKPKYECMSVWYTETNPQTGQRMKYPWYCHDFRNCYVCHTKRRTDFQSQLINALQKGIEVAVIRLDDPRAKTLKRKLPVEAYLRLPAEKDAGALFFDASYSDREEETLPANFAETEKLPFDLSWFSLTNTPEGSRPSGKLGMEEKEEEDKKGSDDFAKISVVAIMTNSNDRSKTEEAWNEAVKETEDLDPQTADEVEDAITLRMSAYQDALNKRDIKVVDREFRQRWVRLSLLSWREPYYKLNDIGRHSSSLNRS